MPNNITLYVHVVINYHNISTYLTSYFFTTYLHNVIFSATCILVVITSMHVVEKMTLCRDVVKNMTLCRDVVIIYHHMYI